MIDLRDLVAWSSGAVGSAVAALTLFRWHWFEIRRAHERLDLLERKILKEKHA